MESKDVKRLIAAKSDIITFGKGMPGKDEGRNGHITIRSIKAKGIHLFVKVHHKWYSIPLNEKFVDRDKASRIISKKPPRYVGAIGFEPVSQEFELKQSATDSIKYKGAQTKVERNINDGNPTFQVGSSDTENFRISVNYSTGGKAVETVFLTSNTDSASANMGSIHIRPDITRHTIFDDNGLRLHEKTFTINSSADESDTFTITTTTNAATTIQTTDDSGEAGDLTFDIDGDVNIDSHTGIIQFKKAGTAVGNYINPLVASMIFGR